MRLHSNPASPFARKVIVLAHETDLIDRIDVMNEKVTPVAPNPAIVADNPLGKIPCLVTDDGLSLYDSRVICEYLDTLHTGTAMFPAEGTGKWAALRHQAVADGLMDAAVLARYETFLRPEELRWRDWIDNQVLKVRRVLDSLEGNAKGLGSRIDIGTISIGCALGYLDFRYSDLNWREHRPELADWFETFSARASMEATRPS